MTRGGGGSRPRDPPTCCDTVLNYFLIRVQHNMNKPITIITRHKITHENSILVQTFSFTQDVQLSLKFLCF